jgi:hypothetical protein
MYEHLQHFLEKVALAQTSITPPQEGAPALVPDFPSSAGVNKGMASPPPQPPPGSIKALNPPVSPGGPVSGGVGASTTGAVSSPKSSKTGAIRSVDDFTSRVRGPMSAARRDQFSSPFDNPIEWGEPTSVEGGDGGARWAPSGTTHPDVKIAQEKQAIVGALMRRMGVKALGRAASSLGGKAVGKASGQLGKRWAALQSSRLGKAIPALGEAGESLIQAPSTVTDLGKDFSANVGRDAAKASFRQSGQMIPRNPLGGLAKKQQARRMQWGGGR